jgi:Excalibur calcium-binding domain
MRGFLLALALGAFLAVLLAAPGGATTERAMGSTSIWDNCTKVHTRYPHGVGKRYAHDKTSGTPVTNFKRSTLLYNRAMSYNRGLDRDKDGIACEKH